MATKIKPKQKIGHKTNEKMVKNSSAPDTKTLNSDSTSRRASGMTTKKTVFGFRVISVDNSLTAW